MKKSLSIILTLLTILNTVYCSTFCAFAETTTRYWEPIHGFQDGTAYINGELTDEIGTTAVPDTKHYKITYYGKGVITNWEFPTLTENKDYTIISQDHNSITVLWTNEDQGAPYINAIVDFSNEASVQKITTENTGTPSEKNTEKSKVITKETDISEKTTAKNTENMTIMTNINSDNNKSIIIGGIIAIIFFSAIIAILVRKKTAK